MLGAIVAVTTALSAPIGYCIIGYLKEADALTYKAELTPRAPLNTSTRPTRRRDTPPSQLAAISEIRTPTAAPISSASWMPTGSP